MQAIIVGAGIGGLAAALSLQKVGIAVEVFDQVRDLGELGVGLNVLPPATHVLAAHGLLPGLDRFGIRTSKLVYANRFGQIVWREPRGLAAGHDFPQFSIHRGRLHALLVQAVYDQLGPGHVHTACSLVGFEERGTRVIARFERRGEGRRFEVAGDVLIGCDGIHSAVRAKLYPAEGPPVWSGLMLWRGALQWPVYEDGGTMVIAGGTSSKFVVYPIGRDPRTPDRRLTNWAVVASTGRPGERPPRREDWNRPGDLGEALQFVRERFSLGFVDPVAMIEATGTFYEFPNCDRDPLPRWSFGRTTLLGDAAHPMYPVGSNGATQAVLDADALGRHVSNVHSIVHALIAYEAERRPITTEIVLSNRRGGPEQVIDLVEVRAPQGFDQIDRISPHAERQALVSRYRSLTGLSDRRKRAWECL